MRDKKTLHIILGLAVFLHALFFQMALPNLVLCFGEDGHLALEWHGGQEVCEHNAFVSTQIFNFDNFHVKTHDVECSDLNLHFHPAYAFKTLKKKSGAVSDISLTTVYRSSMLKTTDKEAVDHLRKYFLQPPQHSKQNTILII